MSTQTEKNIREALMIEGELISTLSYAYLLAGEERQFAIKQKLVELGAKTKTPTNWLNSILEKNSSMSEYLVKSVNLFDKLSNKYEQFEKTANEENLQKQAKVFSSLKDYNKRCKTILSKISTNTNEPEDHTP